MAVMLFARDLTAFPVAWVSGESYQEVKTKALCFIRSAIRVGVACGLIFAVSKWRHSYFGVDRRVVIPLVPRLEMTLAKVPVTLAPTLLINGIMIATASSYLRMIGYGCFAFMQIFNPMNFQNPRPLFSAAVIKETLAIDPYWILANLALNIVPEAQLGPGLYLAALGTTQLAAFTFDRIGAESEPVELALKGIFHLIIGLECWGMYEKYSRQLEAKGTKKETLIYKVSDKLSPWLTWVATGR